MPISLSAKKSHRQSLTRTIQNRSRKRRIHQLIKSASQKNAAEVISIVDKAVKWGLWHKNKAARVKSRLHKQFPSIVSGKPAQKPAKLTRDKKPTGATRVAKAKPRTAGQKPLKSPPKIAAKARKAVAS